MKTPALWPWILFLLPAPLAAAGCATMTGPQATPQRPSYSADTSTTAHGSVEIEAGAALDDADAMSIPLTLKIGAGEASEIFLGWSPWNHLENGEQELEGAGDLMVGTRYRFLESKDEAPSAAFQIAAKLPTADDDEGLGSGQVDAFGSAILTGLAGSATWVAYYQLGVLGPSDDGDAVLEHGLAAAMAHSLSDDLSGFVELTAVLTPAREDEQLLAMVGLGYAVGPSLILDAAMVVGLTDDSTELQGTVGFTWNVGRILGDSTAH